MWHFSTMQCSLSSNTFVCITDEKLKNSDNKEQVVSNCMQQFLVCILSQTERKSPVLAHGINLSRLLLTISNMIWSEIIYILTKMMLL